MQRTLRTIGSGRVLVSYDVRAKGVPKFSANQYRYLETVVLVCRHPLGLSCELGLVRQADAWEGIQGAIRLVARDSLQLVEGLVHHNAAPLQGREDVVTLLDGHEHDAVMGGSCHATKRRSELLHQTGGMSCWKSGEVFQ